MRIGFLLPGMFAIGTRGNGVAEQARCQASALERRGHTVVRLNPWEWQDERSLDVLHFFMGGAHLTGVTRSRQLTKPGLLVFAPIIDSNKSLLAYRFASVAGGLSSRLLTVPGILREQARASDLIVCRSRHELMRLARGLGISTAKLAIALNGCDPPERCAASVSHVREQLNLPEHFLLHVSAYTQKRKNVLRLADAAQALGYPLVVAGTGTAGPVLSELQRRARNSNRLRLLDFVDADTKAALYSACRVFCLPSLHEGTGLAALEAAAHGANLVITKNGGAPDYFRDYVDYVDPYSADSIRDAIAKAWRRPRDDGLRQHVCARLTWDESARSLEALYLERLESKREAPGSRAASVVTPIGDGRALPSIRQR